MRDRRRPREQRVQGIWEGGDFQYFEDYDDAYDDEWHERDFLDDADSYNDWTDHDANFAPAAGSTTVDALAAAQHLAAQCASSSTQYPPVAPNAMAPGTTPKPTMVATVATTSKGLPGNLFIMPVLTKYNGERFTTERLFLDSGAECCVCPRGRAPECPIEPLHAEQVARLITVAGDHMMVYGFKYGRYTSPKGRWMVWGRYLLCDTRYPAVSVAGLCHLGNRLQRQRDVPIVEEPPPRGGDSSFPSHTASRSTFRTTA